MLDKILATMREFKCMLKEVIITDKRKMAINIDVYKLKELNIRGATVVDGISNTGMISSIVANYIINNLKLEEVGFLDSDNFPAVSLVYDSMPKYPAGIFADEEKKIVVFLSEFTPEQHLVRPIANTILAWAAESKCRRIITTGALVSPEGQTQLHKEHRIFGVGNVDTARKDLKKLDVTQLKAGYITGVPAILINNGMRANFNVICLLAEVWANNGIPDATAAAKVIEVIAQLHPKVEIDVEPLYEEAEKIEVWVNEQQQSPSLMFG